MNTILPTNQPLTLGLTESAHPHLKRLKEDGHFAEMADAYRFGVALALARGVIPEEIAGVRRTIFNTQTIDPDREIFTAVKTILGGDDIQIYSKVERLAEWGVLELARQSEPGEIDFVTLLNEAVNLASEGGE